MKYYKYVYENSNKQEIIAGCLEKIEKNKNRFETGF